MILGGGSEDNGSSDDWFVEASDEEESSDTTKTPYVPWTPDPKEILSMFTQLEKDKVLELRWKCPGRRPPSPERDDDDKNRDDEEDMYSDDDIKDEEEIVPGASAFDFDDFGMEASTKMTPRRTPGSKSTPKSQKKVASMDNVLNKIRHQQKEKAALKEARRGMSRSPASPAARFRLGMTGSPGGASPRRVVSSTGTPLRAPVGEDSPSEEATVASKDDQVSRTPPEVPMYASEREQGMAEPPTSAAENWPND